MKLLKLAVIMGVSLLLGACATPPKDAASLDAKIADVSKGDFGQFSYHQSMAEHSLDHLRKIKQYWQDDHYWNIENEAAAQEAGAKYAEHTKQAEDSLNRWWTANHEAAHSRNPMLGEKRMPLAYFDTAKDRPRGVEEANVQTVLNLAKEHPDLTVDVIGYTDTVGTDHYNRHLAARRAHVVHELLDSHGLPGTVEVFEVAEGKALGPQGVANADNRRVDIHIHPMHHEPAHEERLEHHHKYPHPGHHPGHHHHHHHHP